MSNNNLKVYDMFAGIGGFSLAFQQAGNYEITANAEIDKYPSEVLKKNFPSIPNFGDVTKITYQPNQFDVIIGGFPCTDISIASKTKDGIYGKRSILWKEFFRAVTEVRPRYCVIENVFMLLRRGLNTILSDLAKIGYDATYTTIDAQFLGTPQRRRRVYILGVRDGIPANTDIFQLGERSTDECERKVQSLKESFTWNFEQSEKREQAFAYFTRQRSDEFAGCGVSSTLMKRDYKDFTDVVVSNGKIRRVTPTERLRLMGFPDDWHLANASDTDKYKYCGMHVPSVKYIAECLNKYHKETIKD